MKPNTSIWKFFAYATTDRDGLVLDERVVDDLTVVQARAAATAMLGETMQPVAPKVVAGHRVTAGQVGKEIFALGL